MSKQLTSTDGDSDARKEAYLARFAQLDPANQRRHLAIALQHFVTVLRAQADKINADQDDVDADFYALMDGVL